MANDKNNSNELVTDDDDPTAEFETVVLPQVPAESAADTHGFEQSSPVDRDAAISELESNLKNRSETINRLQFDIEQLRAKWTGLETEITAREEQTVNLNSELDAIAKKLASKDMLLKKRDLAIKSLKAEIRDRNNDYTEINATVVERDRRIDELQQTLNSDRGDEAQRDRLLMEKQAGQIASADLKIGELLAQIERTESYADALRQQVQDRTSVSAEAEDTREYLQSGLAQASQQLDELRAALQEEKLSNVELQKTIDGLDEAHEKEVRRVRFELGEAQETVAQHELLTEQLASDLVDTRGFRDELELMLNKAEEQSKLRIEQLEKENRTLLDDAADHKDKLESNSEAINCLLAELAKKSQQIDSIGVIENVIHDIDDRMSERIDERPGKEKERVTRVLIGSIDGQELRFPLFKDRLTIGRTEQNDIQLKASYVSRRHAVISTEREATRVIDWGSKNGVFVNSEQISEHFLRNGDKVTIGTADFRYEERPKRDS